MAGYFTFFLLIFLVNYSNVSNANKLNISFFLITLFVGLRYGIGFDYFHITRLFKTIIWKQSLYHACLLMLPITPTFPFSFL